MGLAVASGRRLVPNFFQVGTASEGTLLPSVRPKRFTRLGIDNGRASLLQVPVKVRFISGKAGRI